MSSRNRKRVPSRDTLPTQIPDVDALDSTTLDHARRTVAGHSADAAECALFWKMLGIHPEQADEATYTGGAGVPRPPNARSLSGLKWE